MAIGRDVFPPVSFGDTLLQRMRVMLAPHDAPLAGGKDTAPVAAHRVPAPARRVTGEILRDETGRLYEKLGSFVRLLGTIEASVEGDLMEVGRPEQRDTVDRTSGREAPGRGMAKREVANREDAKPRNPGRRLFPEPGQWRVLGWGEFRSVLARQIAHPERLREEHRLPCYVQVLEALSAQPVEEFAWALFGNAGVARELMMLTPTLAERLEIAALLPAPPRRAAAPRERGVLLPGDRLFRLQVAMDPTAEPGPPPAAGKRTIPERYLLQTFARSREDALFDMRASAGLGRRFAGWLGSVFSRSRFERWQRSLWGKTPDQQLWESAPPAGMFGDSRVREWAHATLEMAGYDASALLREWEIYWRRRAERDAV